MHTLLRTCGGLWAAGFALAASACRPEPTAARHPPAYDESPQYAEEEFFGDIYQNGQRATSTAYTASLSPRDSTTDARLLPPRSFTVWANPNASHMYGWWDPAGGGACGGLTEYLAGQRGAESHSNGPGQPPSGTELHCIRPGVYIFSVPDKVFRIDYLQMAGHNYTINNTTAGVAERLEATSYYPGQAGNWIDHVVHVDLTPGNYQETRLLDVDNAGADPLSPTFTNQPSPAGTELDYFRFSAAQSSSGWNLNSQGRALARLYWDFNTNKTITTNYYDAHSTAHVIRHHRFESHVHESRNAVVALELMRPDEEPDDTVNVATRVVAITRTTPVACGAFEGTTTWPYTDQILNAACSTRGAGMQYRWQFDVGGPWTPYAPDTLYDYFAGHDAAGTHQVTVEALNTTTGMSGFASYPFSVSASRIVLDGRTYVTDKATNLYTSNYALVWREKFDHDTQWWPGTAYPSYSMSRIWFAGVYTVDLRQQDSSVTFLRRGRLHITVCNPPSSCAPERAPSIPVAPAAPPVLDDWGLFGAGPWLSWGTGNAVRFYDLIGAHDVPNRFADVGWLDGPDGQASATGAGSYLSATRRPLQTPDARAFDFAIAPPDAGVPFTFGLALDPDLGPNAADDEAGYDASRGLVYVFDGTRAVGFLLRDAQGRSALRGVMQYGLARRSPLTAEATSAATRARGISLLTGRSDVQLLLTAPAQPGPVTWTFVLVRGASLGDLRTRADAVLTELASNR